MMRKTRITVFRWLTFSRAARFHFAIPRPSAGKQDLTVVNATGVRSRALVFTHTRRLQEDVLGQRTCPCQSVEITSPHRESPLWDLRLLTGKATASSGEIQLTASPNYTPLTTNSRHG